MTSGQETEQVYSYNPGARTGPINCETALIAKLSKWKISLKLVSNCFGLLYPVHRQTETDIDRIYRIISSSLVAGNKARSHGMLHTK